MMLHVIPTQPGSKMKWITYNRGLFYSTVVSSIMCNNVQQQQQYHEIYKKIGKIIWRGDKNISLHISQVFTFYQNNNDESY